MKTIAIDNNVTKIKNKLTTFEPKNDKKLKNTQAEL